MRRVPLARELALQLEGLFVSVREWLRLLREERRAGMAYAVRRVVKVGVCRVTCYYML